MPAARSSTSARTSRCIELHSKKNAIGDDIVSLITQTLNPASEHVRNFRGFVISGDASDFSVGANLMQLLLGIQEGEWDEVDSPCAPSSA